ncbi:MAG TPA: ABC transporter permease [Candidatus Nanopelagicales bacterium]|nr:ABC transporter permease [Candidatus Nanopelagicales bacterium]
MSARYLARQSAQAIFTIVMIVLLNFLLFRMMPGSPDRVNPRNPNVTAEQREAAKARWGLDKPLIPDQLVAFVGSTLKGDLGYSMKFQGQPVVEVIGDRFWPTILLIGLAEVIAIFLGLALGAYTGWRRGGSADRIGNGLSLILYSMPYFVIGMPLIIIFAAGLGWFPTSGMQTAGATFDNPIDFLLDLGSHLVLPLATISLGLIGGYSILMRSSVTETRAEDYIATARAKGLSDGKILRSHAIPNALLPAVTLIAINLGYVVGGAITAEIVFNWPGLGTLTVDALNSRDYPVLQGIFLFLGVSVVLANFAADIVYGYLDPRVRR